MTEKMLARVAVSSVPYAADRLYTYLVPDELIGSAEVGKRVTIPFGRGNRRVEGFLLEVGREAATSPLKPIDALLDDAPLLDAKDIRLVRWMKARYFCTYYDAIKTILPGGVWLQYRELWHVNGEISAEDALSSVAPDSLEETLLRAMLSAKEIERAALDELGGEKTAKALRSLEACGLAVRETKLRQRLQDKSVRMVALCVSAEDALAYLDSAPVPTVIKADGLALGKGVIIAATRDEAKDAVVEIMRDKKFGKSGDSIVIEEFLTGPEVSVLSFTDGKTVVPMVSSMDHKRALDNDGGLNTGGMGTVAPNPYYTEEIAERCMKEIFLPTVNAMNAEGRTFKGCLYFGLMLTENGPKVIEYNCRFGDPETQVVLPLLKSDLLTVMQATTNGTLADASVEFSTGSACCVVLASEGYPKKYESGFPITMSEEAAAHCYLAGAKKDGDTLLTVGGRVLGITAVRDTLEEAVRAAYAAAERVHFDGKYSRSDIGLSALRESRLKNG